MKCLGIHFKMLKGNKIQSRHELWTITDVTVSLYDTSIFESSVRIFMRIMLNIRRDELALKYDRKSTVTEENHCFPKRKNGQFSPK